MPSKIPIPGIYKGVTADAKSGCLVLVFYDREPIILWDKDNALKMVNDMCNAVNKAFPDIHRTWDGERFV